jgi:hypothetical protein
MCLTLHARKLESNRPADAAGCRRGALGIDDGQAAGRLAHQHLAVRREGDVARERFAAEADAFGAGYDFRTATAQNGCGGVRCAEIDAIMVMLISVARIPGTAC